MDELRRRLATAEHRALTAETEAQALRQVISQCEAAVGALMEALGASRTGGPTPPRTATQAGEWQETHDTSGCVNGSEKADQLDSSEVFQELPF